MRKFNKVFGIGFPRTGTCSLAAALYELGIPCVHYPVDAELLNEYPAACDITITFRYAELDRRFPGSLFIFTERNDPVALFNSLRKVYPHRQSFPRPLTDPEVGHNPEGIASVYNRHKQAVISHFSSEPHRLLFLNIFDDSDPYATLSAFLQAEKPTRPFPRLNSDLIAKSLQNILIRDDGFVKHLDRVPRRGNRSNDDNFLLRLI